LSNQSIRKYWSSKGELLYTYKLSQLDNPRLLKSTIEYLSQCGFPRQSAPALSFDYWDKETIPTPNQVLGIDLEELENYLMIGNNGSGDPICIDLDLVNQVVYLNHDNYFERVFMNGSVSQLIESIIQYQIFYTSLNPKYENDVFSKRAFSDEEFNELKADFLKIDIYSLNKNSFWDMELEYLLWERENE